MLVLGLQRNQFLVCGERRENFSFVLSMRPSASLKLGLKVKYGQSILKDRNAPVTELTIPRQIYVPPLAFLDVYLSPKTCVQWANIYMGL